MSTTHKYTELEIEEIIYLRSQVPVLAAFALRDCNNDNIRQEILTESNLDNEPLYTANGSLNYTRQDLFQLLRWFSSLVDKAKPGGWIASTSSVFRVECISQQGADSKYNTTDEVLVRYRNHPKGTAVDRMMMAREIAAKLNSL